MQSDRKNWIDIYTVYRGKGGARATVKRFGDLLADLLEMRAAEVEATSRGGVRAAAEAANLLRIQAARARTLVTVADHATDHAPSNRLALTVFANVLDEAGIGDTLRGVVTASRKAERNRGK